MGSKFSAKLKFKYFERSPDSPLYYAFIIQIEQLTAIFGGLKCSNLKMKLFKILNKLNLCTVVRYHGFFSNIVAKGVGGGEIVFSLHGYVTVIQLLNLNLLQTKADIYIYIKLIIYISSCCLREI